MNTGMRNQLMKIGRESRSQIVVLGIVALFAAMIGCGGGGGGGGGTSSTSTSSTSTTSTSTTSTSTTSTSTTSTSTTSTSTTNGTTTSETTGTTGSTLPGNRIFFSDTPSELKHMNPDGSDVQTYTSIPAGFKGFAQSPTDSNVVAFAYTSVPDNFPTEPAQYEIYIGSNVSLTGAVQLTSFTDLSQNPDRLWADVGSIMFSPDGTQVYFTAARTQSDGQGGLELRYRLYSVSIAATGQVPTAIDDAEDAFVSPNGQKVVYTYFPPGAGQPIIKSCNADGSGKATLVSTAGAGNYYPQYNKTGTEVCFGSNRTGQFEIWKVASNGSNPVQATNINASNDSRCFGSSFSPSGTEIAFTRANPGNLGESGVFKVPSGGGTEVQVRSGSVSIPVFWSPSGSTMPGRGPGLGATPTSHGTSKRMLAYLGIGD